jgi:putative DNA primase/helicase
MSYDQKTTLAARGKWRGILMDFGIPREALSGRHCPCPLCGGKDRFRWDNRDRTGSYICSKCGAGDGMKLAMAFTGDNFATVAGRVDAMLGNIPADAIALKPDLSEEDRRAMLRGVYAQTARAAPGDLVDRYLTVRGVGQTSYPKALRYGSRVMDGEGGVKPAMVAVVCGPDGKPSTLHRTFLSHDGLAKAEMDSPRKLMPGPVPAGSAIHLSDYSGGPLGIAEGIETALSATHLFEMPVWAAVNATMMAKWHPPDGCTEVAVFGDHDASYAGQAAAYALAARLAAKDIAVTVHIPPTSGQDWADVLAALPNRRRNAA